MSADLDLTLPIDCTAAMAAVAEAEREWHRDRSLVAVDLQTRARLADGCVVVGVEITRWREAPTCPPPEGGERVTREDEGR